MDSQWLNNQFALNSDKSKAGLAREIGLEPSAISKILKGMRQIKATEYSAMRRYFGLPVDGEKAIKNQNNGYVIEPLGANAGLGETESQTDSDWIIPANILSRRTDAPPEHVRIHEIKENMMEPEFKRGEHVLINTAETTPSPPGVFVVSDGFGYLVRHCEYIPASKPPKIKVSAKGDDFQPQVLDRNEFEIIGRVIAKLQWI